MAAACGRSTPYAGLPGTGFRAGKSDLSELPSLARRCLVGGIVRAVEDVQVKPQKKKNWHACIRPQKCEKRKNCKRNDFSFNTFTFI